MSTLYIMVGIPGSGKSYIAKQIAKNICCTIVSRDTIRFSFLNKEDEYFTKEKEVFKEYINEIQYYLDNGEIVIADATHLNQRSRYKLLSALMLRDDDYVVPLVINTSLETCLKRNTQRTGRNRVPQSIIKSMFDTLTDPADDWDTLKEKYYDILYINNEEDEA